MNEKQIGGKFLAIHANEGFQVPMSVYEQTLLQFLFLFVLMTFPLHAKQGNTSKNAQKLFSVIRFVFTLNYHLLNYNRPLLTSALKLQQHL